MKRIVLTLLLLSINYHLSAMGGSRDSLQLQQKSYNIEEVTVYPKNYIKKLVLKAARNFAANYSQDFISTFILTHTVETNGKFRELFAVEALLGSFNFNQKLEKLDFLDENRLDQTVVLLLMRSNPYSYNGKYVMERASIISKESTQKRDLLISYNDCQFKSSLTNKRAIEIYSPLNSKMVDCYEYEVVEEDKLTHTTVVHFKSIDKYFDKRCKISGEGYLYISNNDFFIKKVVMENHIDKLSNFPRSKFITPSTPLATNHRVEINYRLRGSTILPDAILLDVEWADPGVDDGFYYIRSNSRPRPFHEKLMESQRVKFYDIVEVDKSLKKELKDQNIIFPNEIAYPTAPFIENKLDRNRIDWLDWEKLERDLCENGEASLAAQAEINASNLRFYSYDALEQALEKETRLRKINREKLYKLIYKKSYYENE